MLKLDKTLLFSTAKEKVTILPLPKSFTHSLGTSFTSNVALELPSKPIVKKLPSSTSPFTSNLISLVSSVT